MIAPAVRVLVVEDEQDIQDLLVLHLKREGFDVTACSDGASAWRKLSDESFSVVLLDWMLPGGLSGIEIARQIRERKRSDSMSVLMLTARVADADIVAGLEAGADDYVAKPFEMPVLLARVRALIRRSRWVQESSEGATQQAGAKAPAMSQPGGEVIRIGELELGVDSYEVKFRGRLLDLTPYEFKLLHALMRNAGKVLTRDRLIDQIQGSGVSVVDRAIDTHVFGLRKKLGSAADYVETVRGVGYRVSPPSERGK
jgi:two-component system phosphate regulon response regulator PhoB